MESPPLHLGTGLLRVLGASKVGRHQAGQGPLLQGCGQHKHPPGCETEPGRVGTAPLSPLRVCGYPQQTLAALSPPTKGLFPLWEGSGELGGCVRGRLFPQAGRAAGGLRGKDRGRGRVPPLPAAPASEPGGQGPSRGTTKPPSPPGAGLRAAARASPSPPLPLLTRRAPAPAAARSSIVPLPPPRRQSRHGNERHRGARGGAFGY